MKVIITNEESVLEASTRGESQGSLLGEKPAPPAINTTANETSASIIEAGTRKESQSPWLGEKSLTTNEIAIEQEADITNTATIREKSHNSMAEISKSCRHQL